MPAPLHAEECATPAPPTKYSQGPHELEEVALFLQSCSFRTFIDLDYLSGRACRAQVREQAFHLFTDRPTRRFL